MSESKEKAQKYRHINRKIDRQIDRLIDRYVPLSPGGPGSGKGRLVANLRSMFGMRLVSAESIILKYLPKKVQHAMTLTTAEVAVYVSRGAGGEGGRGDGGGGEE